MSHAEFMAVVDRMTNRFKEITKERPKRQDFEMRNGECHLGWVHFEREQMHAEINSYRREHGFEEVPFEKVMLVETTASGHVDYATKWPLYCAELATGRWRGA